MPRYHLFIHADISEVRTRTLLLIMVFQLAFLIDHPKRDGKVLPESYHVSGYNPDYGFCAVREPDGYCSLVGGPPAHGTLVGWNYRRASASATRR